jgi:shikimate dehydrogenase
MGDARVSFEDTDVIFDGVREGELFAVFGHPVRHSMSPFIHARFAQQTGRSVRYEAIDCGPEDLAAALERFAARGGKGANITLPLKAQALALASEISPAAERIGAANTLVRSEAGWRAYNTDGKGLMRDLAERHRFDLRGRRALILGAGGAAHAAAFALVDAGAGELYIVNRTPERAEQLADRFDEPARVHTRYWEDLGQCGSFDLIVNATSAGHGSTAPLDLPYSLIGARCLCYDMSYSLAAIPFLAWARAAGATHALDGLGMLVEQAAESFLLWHGVRPETDEVLALVRARLPAQAME